MQEIREIDSSLYTDLLLNILDVDSINELIYIEEKSYNKGSIVYFPNEKIIAICIEDCDPYEGFNTKKWIAYQKTISNNTIVDLRDKSTSDATCIKFDTTKGIRAQISSYNKTVIEEEDLLEPMYKNTSIFRIIVTSDVFEAEINSVKGYIHAEATDQWKYLFIPKIELKANTEYIIKVNVFNTNISNYLLLNEPDTDNPSYKSAFNDRISVDLTKGEGVYLFKAKTIDDIENATHTFMSYLPPFGGTENNPGKEDSLTIDFNIELYEISAATHTTISFSTIIYADSILDKNDGLPKGYFNIDNLKYQNTNLLDDISVKNNELSIYLKNGFLYNVVASSLLTIGDSKPLVNSVKLESGEGSTSLSYNDKRSNQNLLPNSYIKDLNQGGIHSLMETLGNKVSEANKSLPKSSEDIYNFNESVKPQERLDAANNFIETNISTINSKIKKVMDSKTILTKKSIRLLEKYGEIK